MSNAVLQVLVVLALLLPLTLSALTAASGRTGTAALDLAPWAPLPALALALLALLEMPVATLNVPWLLLGSRFGLDQTGAMFLLLTSFVWLVAGWYARGYMRSDPNQPRFWAFFLATQAGNLGLCLALDAASFYLMFTLMTFAAYGLVVHTGTEEAWRAGRIYLVMAVLGEAALVAGILLAVNAAGDHLFETLAGTPQSAAAIALVLGGFGVKVGVPLLHMWLPLAHPVAPVPASAVLSGVMLKAGVLGWIRFLPLGAAGAPEAGNVMMAAGLLAMFFGVAAGLAQSNVKVLLAYSSISQMGFIILGVGAGLAEPQLWPLLLPAVTLYALHHALAKSALFLGSGVAKSRPGNPLVLTALALPALALAGMPLTSGAVAKGTLKNALSGLPAPWTAALEWMLPLAAMGTALLMMRFMILAARRTAVDVHSGMLAPWTILLLAVAGAVWWFAAPDSIAYAMQAKAILASFWPVAVALLVGAAVVLQAHRLGARMPEIPPGDLLLPLEHALDRVRQASLWRRLPSRKPQLSAVGTRILQRLENLARNLSEKE